jgi:hypothetical protein
MESLRNTERSWGLRCRMAPPGPTPLHGRFRLAGALDESRVSVLRGRSHAAADLGIGSKPLPPRSARLRCPSSSSNMTGLPARRQRRGSIRVESHYFCYPTRIGGPRATTSPPCDAARPRRRRRTPRPFASGGAASARAFGRSRTSPRSSRRHSAPAWPHTRHARGRAADTSDLPGGRAADGARGDPASSAGASRRTETPLSFRARFIPASLSTCRGET